MLTAAWYKVSNITGQNCFERAGISKESQKCTINDTDGPFKELDEELNNLRERQQDHAPTDVNAEIVIECDDELLTADTELPSDVDIIAEFQPNSNGDQEQEEDDENEVVTDEPPPKRPSKQELSHAMDVLQTFSLFVGVDVNSFKSNIKNISRIIDRDGSAKKHQGLLTDYFSGN